MSAEESIRARIPDFPGYDGPDAGREKSDEEIRAYVGERLAAIATARLEALGIDDRARYDRLLLRAEFINYMAFHTFSEDPNAERIAALHGADETALRTAEALDGGILEETLLQLERAFDARDAAMTK